MFLDSKGRMGWCVLLPNCKMSMHSVVGLKLGQEVVFVVILGAKIAQAYLGNGVLMRRENGKLLLRSSNYKVFIERECDRECCSRCELHQLRQLSKYP